MKILVVEVVVVIKHDINIKLIAPLYKHKSLFRKNALYKREINEYEGYLAVGKRSSPSKQARKIKRAVSTFLAIPNNRKKGNRKEGQIRARVWGIQI